MIISPFTFQLTSWRSSLMESVLSSLFFHLWSSTSSRESTRWTATASVVVVCGQVNTSGFPQQPLADFYGIPLLCFAFSALSVISLFNSMFPSHSLDSEIPFSGWYKEVYDLCSAAFVVSTSGDGFISIQIRMRGFYHHKLGIKSFLVAWVAVWHWQRRDIQIKGKVSVTKTIEGQSITMFFSSVSLSKRQKRTQSHKK